MTRPGRRLARRERPPDTWPRPAARPTVGAVEGTDALLVARLAAGDDHALAEAYDTLAPAVHGVALRVLRATSAAEDVVQDVFVQLWTHPERYHAETAPLRTYLMVLARNRALDLLRSDQRRAARQERHHHLSLPPDAPSPGDEVAAKQAARLVQDAVRRLPAGQRRLVELAYFEGMSYREVAMTEGIPEGTAKSRLRAALAKLETMLDQQLLQLLESP
jgi:RNA polymerase sigma-70 factor, ECF subfamily